MVFQRIQVRDMGLSLLAGLERSPFLQTGATLASFQIGGKVPESSDFGRDILGLVIGGSTGLLG